MSFDLRLQRTCDHVIFDEPVSINGLSPNYTSVLTYGSDGASNFVVVREFSATEGLSNFVYARDGFTNWRLSGDGSYVIWNDKGFGGPGSGAASFLDGSSLLSPGPQMMVTYRTVQARCPMCVSSNGIAKDVDFDLHGRLRLLQGSDKVRQLVFKALLTELGANQVIPDYGSALSAAIGEKFDTVTQLRLYNSVQQAIQFLVNEQQNYPELPLDEQILGVSNVGVAQDAVDPRVIRVSIAVRVGDFTKVEINFDLLTS